MKKVVVQREDVKRALIDWINEADSETIERIYNENFDAEIEYDIDFESFIVPLHEVKRNGFEYEPLK